MSNTVSNERLAELQKDCGTPNPPTQETYWFRKALAGEGPHAYDWSDKPHRLVFDLCRLIETDAALRSKPVAGVEVKPADIEDLIEQLLDAQQDINLAANENMDQSLCDASALIDKTEAMLNRILSTLSVPAQEPDHVYDPNDWEYTLPWEDREQLIEEWQPNEVHKVATLVDGPDKWIVWLETNGDYDVHWFDSEAEANSALTAALKEA